MLASLAYCCCMWYTVCMNDVSTLQRTSDIARKKFISATYAWMAGALAVSAVCAYLVAASEPLQRLIFGNSIVFFGLIIAEFALVFFLSARIRTMSKSAAGIAFAAYSVVNGLTLSSVLIVYAETSVARVFVIAALLFGVMTVYGMTTKSDLMSAGRYLFMGLVGIIIASLVNMFLGSSTLDWIISLVGVALFTGLTAYDTQKVFHVSASADGSEAFDKIAIIAALELYLDFINLFLYLLRLFGKKE